MFAERRIASNLCRSHATKSIHVVIHATEVLVRRNVFPVLNQSALRSYQRIRDPAEIKMTIAQFATVPQYPRSQV